MPLIQVVVGSTRDNRFGERAAEWVMHHLSRRDDMDVELVDLRDHPLPFFDAIAPARTGRDYESPETAAFGEVIDRGDGYVMLTPEYNHGYSAVLKNAIDHTFVEWNRKPVSFVGWGNVGGARAIEQLRLVAVEVELAPLRHAVHLLPDVLIPALRAETFDVSMLDAAVPRLDLMAADLVWWANALATAREAARVP
jgi:NAD(P)H-dependent FMN reductase